MNNEIVLNTFRFILLVLVQVILLNHINLFGFVNPYLYIFFIIVFPFTGNKSLLIFLSFLLGLTVDMFGDSGGIHAAACTFIAFIRPFILKISFGISYEFNTVKLNKASASQRLVYISAMVALHHLVLFLMEVFSLKHILLILQSTLFSGIFSIVLIYCTLVLFSRKS